MLKRKAQKMPKTSKMAKSGTLGLVSMVTSALTANLISAGRTLLHLANEKYFMKKCQKIAKISLKRIRVLANSNLIIFEW